MDGSVACEAQAQAAVANAAGAAEFVAALRKLSLFSEENSQIARLGTVDANDITFQQVSALEHDSFGDGDRATAVLGGWSFSTRWRAGMALGASSPPNNSLGR